ncbi:A/G-specific adenine glycosylase [Deltaproteobacteria bacterium]|nr:A/G-specific adenine glycosylase [Deltaproteobacteria bacterium]
MPSVFSLSPTEKKEFTVRLLRWFSAAMRPLPWRESYEPYRVWISEIMLQQTRMDVGVAYFTAWMRAFPTVASVARASEETILKAWEGLGYYARAKNLHAAAKIIVERFGGEFPASHEAIRSLPGIGEYTAGAISSIAFNQPVVAIDANVMRIFSRICDIDVPINQKDVKEFITEAVKSLMPADSPRLFSQALMELGALVCAKKADCAHCPLTAYCEAQRLGVVEKRPKKAPAAKQVFLAMASGVIMHDGLVFIQKRPPYGVWASLWEFPGGCLEAEESPEEALLREIAEETELIVSIREKIGVFRHVYTTNHVAMHAYFCDLQGEKKPVLHAAISGKWVKPPETASYAFPAGHRKLLEHLGWGR